jgi:hypothetical protein
MSCVKINLECNKTWLEEITLLQWALQAPYTRGRDLPQHLLASRIIKHVEIRSQIYPLDCRVPEQSFGRDRGTNQWRARVKKPERPMIARGGSVFPLI